MRRIAALAVCLAVVVPAAHAAASSERRAAPTDPTIFAFGGTPVSNAVFFPGTGIYDGSSYSSPTPLRVPRGSNVEFVNLDSALVANSHQIRSIKVRKVGRRRVPMFQSKEVAGPGTTSVVTSHVKPGIYQYLCTNHLPMRGFIEVF